jgi:PPM family protein phosphatase
MSDRTGSERTRAERLHLRDVAGATHVGLVRPFNEDSFAMDRDLGLLLVADGVGGRPAGAVAARVAVDAVRDYLRGPHAVWPSEDEPLGPLLGAAIEVANLFVYGLASKSPLTTGMSTTLVAALAARDGVWIGHVGDSRALLFRERRLARLTIDHTVALDARARKRHTPEELRRYTPNTLTRSIGRREPIDVELRFERMLAEDVLVLATDGLTKVVDDADIAGVLVEAESLGTAVEMLIGRAIACGGPDNITVVAARWAERKG